MDEGFFIDMTKVAQYRLFNMFLAIALLVVFIYPLLFSQLSTNQQIYCVHQTALGKACNSCGITHDFKTILSGDYFQNKPLQNVHSIKVFAFFLSLFITRLAISIVVNLKNTAMLIIADSIWHILLAIYAFFHFWV